MKVAPCLWFDGQAEQAANFYVGLFKNSRILATSYYGEAGQDQHGQPAGSVMTVSFELDGMKFTGLNGGPTFTFSEAISFQIECENQAEVDHYWTHLAEGGPPEAQICGWVKDKFGVSWQVVPKILPVMLMDGDKVKAARAMTAMMGMKKMDIAALQRAFDGEG